MKMACQIQIWCESGSGASSSFFGMPSSSVVKVYFKFIYSRYLHNASAGVRWALFSSRRATETAIPTISVARSAGRSCNHI